MGEKNLCGNAFICMPLFTYMCTSIYVNMHTYTHSQTSTYMANIDIPTQYNLEGNSV